jgi:tetratricopeptide (TPR) repeat protein
VVFAVTSQMSWDDELRLAYAHQQQGDFPAAISILDRLVRQAEDFGPEDPRLPIALNNLGRAHHDRGAWFEAEKSYRRAIAILERASAAARLVPVLNNLALMYIEAGQLQKAERIAARVAAALPHAPGLDPIEFTMYDHNRAYLHIAAGRHGEAACVLVQALRDAERRLGPRVPHVAGLLNALGLNAMSQGYAAEAVPHFERALDIMLELCGPQHPTVARGLINLARAYRETGRIPEAESLARRACGIIETRLGPEHPVLAPMLQERAALLRRLKRGKEAKQLEKRAGAILARQSKDNLLDATVELRSLARSR